MDQQNWRFSKAATVLWVMAGIVLGAALAGCSKDDSPTPLPQNAAATTAITPNAEAVRSPDKMP